nr:Fur-regulated basic protein FbpA [Priestia aryabhattai]
MENLLRAAVRQRKQYLIEELLKKGIYKKKNIIFLNSHSLT